MNCLKKLIELVEKLINTILKHTDMSTIKMFSGKEKPSLKIGEWASNGIYAYLGLGHKQNKIFQSVFDVDVNQKIAGFEYVAENRSFYIPSGTPLSRVQILLNNLPKSLKLNTNDIMTSSGAIIYSDKSIKISFDTVVAIGEENQYIDDLEYNLTIRDFSYKIKFAKYHSEDCPSPNSGGGPGGHGGFGRPGDPEPTIECKTPEIILDKEVLIYNSDVEIAGFRFKMNGSGQNASGMFRVTNSTLLLDRNYLVHGTSGTGYLGVGSNSNVTLKNNTYSHTQAENVALLTLIGGIGLGSNVRIIGGQKEDGGRRTRYLSMFIAGSLYVVDPDEVLESTNDKKLAEYLKPSFEDEGGTCILGGLDFDTKDQTAIKNLSNALHNAGVTDIEIDTNTKKLVLTYNDGNSSIAFTGV